MRNNRIEHLEEAPYATNDRAFYIYLDEATDGYTIETTGVRLNVSTRIVPATGMYGEITGYKWQTALKIKPEG